MLEGVLALVLRREAVSGKVSVQHQSECMYQFSEQISRLPILHLCLPSQTESRCFDSRRTQVPLETADGSYSSVTVIDDCNCQPTSLSAGAQSDPQ